MTKDNITGSSSFSKETSLEDLRLRIDAVDSQILALLKERAGISLKVGAIKKLSQSPVYCPEREEALLRKLAEANNRGAAEEGRRESPLPNEHLVLIYKEILSSSRALQRPLSVACLGPKGTFSYLACEEFFGKSTDIVPLSSIEAVFASVSDDKNQLGIIPLENSLQGSVGQSFDYFTHYNVHICADFIYRVRHSLLSSSKDLKKITKVYSHPQPLAQCAGWIKGNLPEAELVPTESTAEAAALAAKDENSAAIGHENLAELHELSILANGIEDLPNNYTRFALIAHGDSKASGQRGKGAVKTTLLFTIDNKPGALAGVLKALEEDGLNLSKLESRPSGDASWSYNFFADIDDNLLNYPKTISKLAFHCHFWRILGVYRAVR